MNKWYESFGWGSLITTAFCAIYWLVSFGCQLLTKAFRQLMDNPYAHTVATVMLILLFSTISVRFSKWIFEEEFHDGDTPL